MAYRKELNIPFIFSISSYFTQDFIVRAATIISEKKRSQVTNMEKTELWEGGGDVFVRKHNMQLGSVSTMFCFHEHWAVFIQS